MLWYFENTNQWNEFNFQRQHSIEDTKENYEFNRAKCQKLQINLEKRLPMQMQREIAEMDSKANLLIGMK